MTFKEEYWDIMVGFVQVVKRRGFEFNFSPDEFYKRFSREYDEKYGKIDRTKPNVNEQIRKKVDCCLERVNIQLEQLISYSPKWKYRKLDWFDRMDIKYRGN